MAVREVTDEREERVVGEDSCVPFLRSIGF